MISVTKPFLPPIEEYHNFLAGVWQRNWLTNNGPLVNELELKLKEYLSLPHTLFVTNGTVALQVAIRALNLSGEILTTPFSYVATSSSIVWENCVPKFVDIDPVTLNIDVSKIEAQITGNTSGILATHVYGNPCDIQGIEKIAKSKGLKVIYDAAHCFGTKYMGKSIFEFGDISTVSFHATKIFHTVEGGAVFTKDPALLKKMAYLSNFGHNGPLEFAEVGINGKNSEFHAAMGLVNLKYIERILEFRKEQVERYRVMLNRKSIRFVSVTKDSVPNNSYFPVIFETEELNLKVIAALEANKVVPRRYFYPSLNTVGLYGNQEMPVSEQLSKRVLCLPLYYTLSIEEIDFISRIILRAIDYSS